jgi:hypothetical protein
MVRAGKQAISRDKQPEGLGQQAQSVNLVT